MDAVLSLRHSVSHENGFHGIGQFRVGAGTDRLGPSASTAALAAAQSSASVPMAFQGMLKTTTETGDIGIFSIKPSRVHQAPHNRAHAYQRRRVCPGYSPSLHDYPPPAVDDRRRLPSYARDATSEVVSLYETASQKSSGRFEESDGRSYSMTQSSYYSYPLNKHRSNTSLRSQPEGNKPPTQCPRSPFVYPARLRRPGLRPSSPALTDGGLIDYSRRAEIERTPQDINSRHAAPSPLSFYAQKRNRPTLLRPGGHNSNPSLLSQSPHGSSASPILRRESRNHGSDWRCRNVVSSIDTSPARSTFSFASTTNLRHAAPAPSIASTPGKAHPPSPLYYDYTEDFVGEPIWPLPAKPPPQFMIEESIPEDGPVHEDIASADVEISFKAPWNSRHDPRESFRSTGVTQPPSGTSKTSKTLHMEPEAKRATQTSAEMRNISSTTVDVDSCECRTVASKISKTISLSGLDPSAQKLNSHVEEAFGLSPSTIFDLLNVGDRGDGEEGENSTLPFNKGSDRSISGTCLEGKASPIPGSHHHLLSSASEKCNGSAAVLGLDSGHVHCSQDWRASAATLSNRGNNDRQVNQNALPRSLILERQGRRFLGPSNTSAGLDEQAASNNGVEELKTLTSQYETTASASDSLRDYTSTPTAFDGSGARRTSSEGAARPLLASRRHVQKTILRATEPLGKRISRQTGNPESSAVPALSSCSPHESPHLRPWHSVSRSGSPMLAPKPISPARELKLKNSIPQLMKALPPIPPSELPKLPLVPVNQRTLSSRDPVFQSTLKLSVRMNDLDHQQLQGSKSSDDANQPQLASRSHISMPQRQPVLVRQRSDEGRNKSQPACDQPEQTVFTSSPRLRLKLRSLQNSHPGVAATSPHMSIESDCQISNQDLVVDLPETLDEESRTSGSPRFNLKITRASSSTFGTVRVQRGPLDSKRLSVYQFDYPKDLFTPDGDGNGTAPQVTRNLQPAVISDTCRSTVANKQQYQPPSTVAGQAAVRVETRNFEGSSPLPALPIPLNPIVGRCASDVKSFFSDDSSHIQAGHHSLRKRLSNLRARMAIPYTSKSVAHSFDDLFLQQAVDLTQSLTHPGPRPTPNKDRNGAKSEARSLKRLTERIHVSKMQKKVSVWLKEARAAISNRVKARSSTGRSDDV